VATLKKYNLQGTELGTVELCDTIASAEANGQMIKDYIVALRNNARQWSAHTQTRGEVNHSTKKPHPQKHTGKARQGRLSSPQYKGGGVVFGPRAKFDQHVSINRKEKQAAIRALIGEKAREQRIHILDSVALEKPHTKTVAQFLEKLALGKRVLFLTEGDCADSIETVCSVGESLAFRLSVRNLPKTNHMLLKNVNGYELLLAQDLVVTEKALNELVEWLGKPTDKSE